MTGEKSSLVALDDAFDETTDILELKLAQARKSDPPNGVHRSRLDLLEEIVLRTNARMRRRILRLEILVIVFVTTATAIEILDRAGVIHFGK